MTWNEIIDVLDRYNSQDISWHMKMLYELICGYDDRDIEKFRELVRKAESHTRSFLLRQSEKLATDSDVLSTYDDVMLLCLKLIADFLRGN